MSDRRRYALLLGLRQLSAVQLYTLLQAQDCGLLLYDELRSDPVTGLL